MNGPLWRNGIGLVIAGCVLADLHACHGPLHRRLHPPATAGKMSPNILAQVQNETVTIAEFETALRDHLWRRGEGWDSLTVEDEDAARDTVIERLIDAQLVQAPFATANPGTAAGGAADELTMFSKQFETPEDFEARMSLRGLSQADLSDSMKRVHEVQESLEPRIAARMKPVTDRDVTEWLGENGAAMMIPAVFGVAHVYLTKHDPKLPDREAEMREIHRKLEAGEATFEQLALQHSEDERSKHLSGTLGWCASGRMPDDFMNAVEKLDVGDTSGPVETKLGWHLIRLIGKKPARAPSAGEVRDEVAAMLRAERRAAASKALVAELRAQFRDRIHVAQDRVRYAEPAR